MLTKFEIKVKRKYSVNSFFSNLKHFYNKNYLNHHLIDIDETG